MTRVAANASVDEIIQAAVSGVMTRVAPQIAKAIAEAAASRLEHELTIRGSRKQLKERTSRRRPADITKWVADRRARRVPKFVIEMTGGIDTKKRIVAKYGADVLFEKGKPAPKPAKAA